MVIVRNSEDPEFTVPVNELMPISSSIWASRDGHQAARLGQDWVVELLFPCSDSAFLGFSLLPDCRQTRPLSSDVAAPLPHGHNRAMTLFTFASSRKYSLRSFADLHYLLCILFNWHLCCFLSVCLPPWVDSSALWARNLSTPFSWGLLRWLSG